MVVLDSAIVANESDDISDEPNRYPDGGCGVLSPACSDGFELRKQKVEDSVDIKCYEVKVVFILTTKLRFKS